MGQHGRNSRLTLTRIPMTTTTSTTTTTTTCHKSVVLWWIVVMAALNSASNWWVRLPSSISPTTTPTKTPITSSPIVVEPTSLLYATTNKQESPGLTKDRGVVVANNNNSRKNIPSCPKDQPYTFLDDWDPALPSTPSSSASFHNNHNIHNPIRTQKKIPYILYQTSKGRCLPTDIYNATIGTWREPSSHHPSSPLFFPPLGYQFYDDPRLDEYLHNDTHWKSIFPGLSLALQCIEYVHLPVMKADLWRYLILWERGGIFADLDVVLDPHQSFLQHLRRDHDGDDDDDDDDALFVLDPHGPNNNVPSTGHLSQWLMAVCPSHPLMYYAAERAIELVLKAKRAIPIQHTGPRALHDATDRFLMPPSGSQQLLLQGGTTTLYTEEVGVDHSESSSHQHPPGRRRPFSFRVAPASWARNLAFPHDKQRLYALMNMTHYRDHQKGKKHYPNGVRCVEFLGGVLHKDGTAFTYLGTTYHFHNPMPV
jgi:Glycosyltransferase sugar-binding region containing DXD motif